MGAPGEFESFSFQTSEGVPIEIRESPPRAREQETHFQPAPGRLDTPVYSLSKPVVVSADNQSFQLAYTSSITDCTLRIFSDRAAVLKNVPLPPSSGTLLRFLVPMEKGDRIWGFQLAEASPGAAQGALELAGAGTAPFVHGFAVAGDGLTVDGSVAVLAASPGSVSARITEAAREQMMRGTWVLSLGLDPNSAGGRVSFMSSDGRKALFDVSPTSGAFPGLSLQRDASSFSPARSGSRALSRA